MAALHAAQGGLHAACRARPAPQWLHARSGMGGRPTAGHAAAELWPPHAALHTCLRRMPAPPAAQAARGRLPRCSQHAGSAQTRRPPSPRSLLTAGALDAHAARLHLNLNAIRDGKRPARKKLLHRCWLPGSAGFQRGRARDERGASACDGAGTAACSGAAHAHGPNSAALRALWSLALPLQCLQDLWATCAAPPLRDGACWRRRRPACVQRLQHSRRGRGTASSAPAPVPTALPSPSCGLLPDAGWQRQSSRSSSSQDSCAAAPPTRPAPRQRCRRSAALLSRRRNSQR